MTSRARRRRFGTLALAALICSTSVLSGCSTDGGPDEHSTGSAAADAPAFPASATPDYQLGGAYDPADGVGIVGRDRADDPADGLYSICYVNGFQTQPGELDSWPEDLLLQGDDGPVFDPDWPDEALLDTSTSEKREAIAAIVGPWIEGCAASGFQAVEFDNLDTYSRSDGALTLDDNLAMATLLVGVAHDSGLAAGQKNAAEDAADLRGSAGFDFAVVEECAAYRECEAYTRVYGDHVIDIEYTDELPRSFAEMCADPETPRSVVLRDRDLRPAGVEGHVFETCP
ncbi:endo alpha-1,4 polygalactosaminidase [Microbacterium sp. NPDC089695]|uniref:endo alpha-1,4 polygalactosaminidase n=1 Tax=Microbacterium sp. NPDC089695 TaxID=3364198 RepID=UPI0038281430